MHKLTRGTNFNYLAMRQEKRVNNKPQESGNRSLPSMQQNLHVSSVLGHRRNIDITIK